MGQLDPASTSMLIPNRCRSDDKPASYWMTCESPTSRNATGPLTGTMSSLEGKLSKWVSSFWDAGSLHSKPPDTKVLWVTAAIARTIDPNERAVFRKLSVRWRGD